MYTWTRGCTVQQDGAPSHTASQEHLAGRTCSDVTISLPNCLDIVPVITLFLVSVNVGLHYFD